MRGEEAEEGGRGGGGGRGGSGGRRRENILHYIADTIEIDTLQLLISVNV